MRTDTGTGALTAHAQMEEQVTYPTALLIGRYVKSKVAPSAG